MPRKRKDGPIPISEVVEQLRSANPMLQTAAELSHAGAVLASRPKRLIPPEGFIQRYVDNVAGIAVNKASSKGDGVFDISAFQFSDERPPTREEKDRMEVEGHRYDERRRQWPKQDEERPGASLIETVRSAHDMAEQRRGMGR